MLELSRWLCVMLTTSPTYQLSYKNMVTSTEFPTHLNYQGFGCGGGGRSFTVVIMYVFIIHTVCLCIYTSVFVCTYIYIFFPPVIEGNSQDCDGAGILCQVWSWITCLQELQFLQCDDSHDVPGTISCFRPYSCICMTGRDIWYLHN